MKKHKRMLSLLCAIVLAVTLMAPTALALQGPDVSVPDNYDLIYFVDCGAGAFPANIQTLLAEHTDTVENANTPDQAYDGTWGYTNATDDLEVRNSDSDDIYQSIRNFKSGKNGQTLEYKFAGDAGEYRVFVGLYDIWHDSNGGSRKAAVSVTDGAAQSLTYGSEAHLLSFDATVADGNGLSVKVVPTNTAAGDEGDVLVSFIMVTKKAQEPEGPQKPEAPTAGTSIWGKGGENGKLDVVSTCTNPDAAHKGGNTVTEHKNFISGKYFTNFGEMRLNNGVWEVSAEFDAMDYLDEKFNAPHSAQNVSLTLEYVNNKWCVKTDGEKAVINLEGACALSGPEAPVLGENLKVWVQMYSGEYEPKQGSQIDRNASTYGPSVSFGEVEKTGEQWTCDMTVVGYTEDSGLRESCYLNKNMPEGYRVDPYELRGQKAEKTVKLTYNQENGTWECPAIPLKHTSTGPASTSTVKYGVSFKIENTTQEEGVPALPVENPVHNGGFWVSLYAKNAEGTAYEEVYTQVYDGTQDYVRFSNPVEGGILGTYVTTATVKGADVLAASGLEGYELADNYPTKENDLIFDWDSMTWTAETMIPYFDQPDSTIAKRGLAFKVRPVEGPEAPVLGENLEVWVQIYSGEYEPKGGYRIDSNTSPYGSSVTFGDVEKTGEQWTCDMTVVGYTEDSSLSDNCYLNQNMPEGYEVDPYELDRDGNAKKTVTLTYNQENGKWECPAIPLKHTSNGPADDSDVKYGVSFKIKNTTEAEGAPALPVDNPVHNGGFWVSLYVYAEETGYEEVYTQVYDGTQDYVQFSDPVEGAGILGTYATTATVNGNDVLAASGLKGYELADRKPIKDNELVFDWDSMTWTAETMIPYFDQPDSTIAKRGLAFLVEKTEEHTVEAIAAVAPTCTEDGSKAYWHCTDCGKYFADEACTQEIQDIDTWKVIPATGHAYGEPAFQWSTDGKTCTVTFTCGNDETHVETLDAEVTSNLKTAPTCTEKGVTAYTAKVTFQDQDYTDTLELTDIPATGHAYGEPAFQWSADGKTCTVTFTCGNDETHVETLDAEVTSNLKTAPTCTEKGVTVYTAKVTFEGKDYTATLELTDIPAAGHHYEDGACTVCGEKDPDYVEPTTEPTTEPTKPATDPDGPDQTGDTTPVALLMSLLLISAACLTAVIAKSRKIRF